MMLLSGFDTLSKLNRLPSSLPESPDDSPMESCHRTLPIFLYNSLMISHEQPMMGLNLFEPRYRVMCERILAKQIPPFFLFVPNYHDYIPKPGDAGFVVHVTVCRPSSGGQFELRGKLVTERRVIELSWVEAGTGNLFFALTSPLPPKPTGGESFEHNAFSIAEQFLSNSMVLSTSKTSWKTQGVHHIYNCHSPFPESHTLLTINHRDPRDPQFHDYLRCQVHVRANFQSFVDSAATNILVSSAPPQFLIEDMVQFSQTVIAKAKSRVLQCSGGADGETDPNPLQAKNIAVLPSIPPHFFLNEIFSALRVIASLPWRSTKLEMKGINLLMEQHGLTPSVFFRGSRNSDANAGTNLNTTLYGRLPLSRMRIRSSLRGNVMNEMQACVNSFPYLSDLDLLNVYSNKEKMEVGGPYFVHVYQGYSVNFLMFGNEIGVDASDARCFLRKCSITLNWPVVRLLFIGGAQVEGGTRLCCLPEQVTRHIASFFTFDTAELIKKKKN